MSLIPPLSGKLSSREGVPLSFLICDNFKLLVTMYTIVLLHYCIINNLNGLWTMSLIPPLSGKLSSREGVPLSFLIFGYLKLL
jgi:hypothetical protein